MNIKHLFILCSIFMTSQVIGQVSGGVIASYNTSTASTSTTKVGNAQGYVTDMVEFKELEDSYSYGLFTQYNTGHMIARVEGMITETNARYSVTPYSIVRSDNDNLLEKSRYVDINVLAGLDYEGFNITTGPAFHFLTSHENELETLSSFDQDPVDISYGIIGSIGYDLGRFHMDMRYERNFRDIDNNATYSGRALRFDTNPNLFKFTVGMRLF